MAYLDILKRERYAIVSAKLPQPALSGYRFPKVCELFWYSPSPKSIIIIQNLQVTYY